MFTHSFLTKQIARYVKQSTLQYWHKFIENSVKISIPPYYQPTKKMKEIYNKPINFLRFSTIIGIENITLGAKYV